MKDQYGRDINYMRVSITDRCNLRCRYCMPEGIEWLPMEQILTLEEITEACRQAAALGIRKIKVTGGEPLVPEGLHGAHRDAKRIARYRAGDADYQRRTAPGIRRRALPPGTPRCQYQSGYSGSREIHCYHRF